MEGSQQTEDAPPTTRYRGRGEAAPPVTAPEPPTVPSAISLAPGDVLAGRLVYNGDVRVHGTMEGEATLSGDLHVESQGTVKAKLQARNLSVRGALEGEVTARDRLQVVGSGTVSGTVRVARLVVEDGALLNGTITMERSGPTANGRPT